VNFRRSAAATDWPGASYHGAGLGMSSGYNPNSFTPTRATTAIQAGVLRGLTSSVIWLT
jgi:hypothetical protein